MSYCAQGRLFSFSDFLSEGDDNHRLLLVLDALDDDELIGKLVSERKGRRNRYPVSVLWQSLIAGKVYGIATVNGLIRELKRNESLRKVVVISYVGLVPKPWHFSRLPAKLSKPDNLAMMKSIFDKAVGCLKELLPELGTPICDCGGKMIYAGRDGKYLKFRCPKHSEPLAALAACRDTAGS